MSLQITGTVQQVLEEQSGEGKNGPWRKQEFILEIPGDYPRQVCVVVWGDNIDKLAVQANEKLTAYIDIASREYNGRWYTDVKAWKVERDAGEEAGPPPFDADIPFPSEGDIEGMPF